MKNRMQIVFLIFCIVIIGITAKLGYEQLFHASQLESGALNARLREIDIKPNRGAVYDRNGNAIAISIATESVYINPRVIRSADEKETNRQNKDEVIAGLASILGLDEAEVAEKVEKDVSFAYIKRHITDEQAELLHERDFKGVYFLEESQRSYPKGTLASQVIGFAGIDNQGLNGIELQYDNTLLGNPGKFLMEYDGAGNEIPQASQSYIPSEPGCDIYLTLDETIQYVVERELKQVVQEQDAAGATAIVMDVKTGAVLAMANYPDYNPNEYVYEVLLRTLAEVHEDPEEDFDDVCVSLYEPDMSQEVLDKIIYTGTEFSDACNNLKKFCQEVPAEGAWLSYLYDADELSYLYGGMSSIMEETENEENRKKLAVYAREIDRIVN